MSDRTERSISLAIGAVLALVALSVAVFAGRGDHAAGDAVTVAGGGSRTVTVQLADMHITPSAIQVAAGTRLVLQVTNTDTVRHDLRIDGGPQTPLLAHGRTALLDLGVVTRSLRGWCTVPGHRAAGMTMAIQVTGATASTHSSMQPMSMPTQSDGAAPAIDFNATPGPDWRPYDPVLKPVPGGRTHELTFTIRDTSTEVAPGVRQTLWTYNGTAPGPILHGRIGDVFIVRMVNDGDMAHGIDFHAGSVPPDGPMRTIKPGESLTYQFTADHSGAWLYHCSTMPMSLHIANGMYGAVIIDPPHLTPVDQQYVLIQSELYLSNQGGVADATKIANRQPDAVVFNGYVNQYDHAPLSVRAGTRIRVWVIDAGPQAWTSFHVVGTQFDTVFKEGAYALRAGNAEHGAAQSLDLAPGQGGFAEFVLPAKGHYPFTDHAMVDGEHGAHGILIAR